MKRIVYFYVLIILFSCKTLMISKSYAKIETISGVILYEFIRNGKSTYYCEINRHLIIEGKKIPFFDRRDSNTSIIHKNKDLERFLGEAAIYARYLFDQDSTENLRLSSFIRHRNRIRPLIGAIQSTSFFQKRNEMDKVYIAFNIRGEVIHYYGVSLEIEDNELPPLCCPKVNNKSYSDFMVLSRCSGLTPLNQKQKDKLRLLECIVDSNRIEIFYCE